MNVLYYVILIYILYKYVYNYVYKYEYFGTISISNNLNLSGDNCLTCSEYKASLAQSQLEPYKYKCLNTESINLTGYDTDKLNKIVSLKEFESGACCCSDENKCDRSDMKATFMCHHFKDYNLDDDVCLETGYDLDKMWNQMTIEGYLEGDCCNRDN